MLKLEVYAKQRQEQNLIQPFGVESALIRSSAWLNQSSDRQKVLQKIGDKEDQELYRHMLDYLLCQLIPFEKVHCMAFYEGEGKQLQQLRYPATIRVYDAWILQCMQVAYREIQADRMVEWGWFDLNTFDQTQVEHPLLIPRQAVDTVIKVSRVTCLLNHLDPSTVEAFPLEVLLDRLMKLPERALSALEG